MRFILKENRNFYPILLTEANIELGSIVKPVDTSSLTATVEDPDELKKLQKKFEKLDKKVADAIGQLKDKDEKKRLTTIIFSEDREALESFIDNTSFSLPARNTAALILARDITENKPNLQYLIPVIQNTIMDNGAVKNTLVEFIETLSEEINGNVKLQESWLNLISYLIDNGNIDGDEDWLFDKWLYDGNEEDVIYKIKACTFLSDLDNIKKFGLVRPETKGTTNEPLSIKDIIGKTGDQIRTLLNRAQTIVPKTNKSITFNELFRSYGLKGEKQKEFLLNLYSKDPKDVVKKVTTYLNKIFKDKAEYRFFLMEDIPGYNKKDPTSIKKVLNDLISSEGAKSSKRTVDTKYPYTGNKKELWRDQARNYLKKLLPEQSRLDKEERNDETVQKLWFDSAWRELAEGPKAKKRTPTVEELLKFIIDNYSKES